MYDAWGNITSVSGDEQLAESNPFRYRGYYQDSESGFFYLQSRYYDGVVGRFLNADHIGIPILTQGQILNANLFTYAVNNPVNYIDHSGHVAANVVGAVIGAIIGVVGGIFLGNWLADVLNIQDWFWRPVFVGAVAALVGATAAAIGYFIGPYIAKMAVKLGEYVAHLITKGKISIGRISASARDAMGITKNLVNNLIKNASNLKYSKTALNHMSSRPYMKSTITIQNIMKAGKPVADSSLKSGLKWVVKGAFNGKSGTWELVVDVATNTIVHYLFRS
ncbi:MAG: RHS repeat-associated core domain-containing protein [Clostridiales bacterium]|nr:RHS repeat-associated core domain-containing protein [Clostridiales bacterium]